MSKIQKADHRARRKALYSVFAGAIVGSGLFFLLEFFIGNVNLWIEANAVFLVEHHYVSFLITLLLVSPVLCLSLYLIRFAGKIVKAERFPPPGMPVIRDVRIMEGKRAIARGRLLQVLCWLIFTTSAVVPLLVWYIFFSVNCLD